MVTEEMVTGALKGVIDPHTYISVFDMGLISDIVVDGSKVSLTFIPTSPFCPMGIKLATDIKHAVQSVPGVEEAVVTITGHIQADSINKMLKEC